MHTGTHTHAHTHTHTLARTRVHTHAHACVRTCTRTHAHTHTAHLGVLIPELVLAVPLNHPDITSIAVCVAAECTDLRDAGQGCTQASLITIGEEAKPFVPPL
jgi:hypothetical protein